MRVFRLGFDGDLFEQDPDYNWRYFTNDDDQWQLVIGEEGNILEEEVVKMPRFVVFDKDDNRAIDVVSRFRVVVQDDGDLVVKVYDVNLVEETPTPEPEPEPDPDPTPGPTPIEQRPTVNMRLLVNLRRRDVPNLSGSYQTMRYNTVITVLEDRVDQEIMDLLGLQGVPIDDKFHWRYSPSEKKFYAERIVGGTVYLEEVSSDPSPPPSGGNTSQLNRSDDMVLKKNAAGKWIIPKARGFGTNNRPMAYFDTHIMVNTNRTDMEWLLTEYQVMGITNVRAYFSHKEFSFEQSLVIMEDFINEAKQRGITVTVVFMDSIGLSNFYIKEDEAYHVQAMGHLTIDYYLQERWRVHAAPRVAKLAAMLAKYDNVILDLCNEPALVKINHDVREFLTPANFYAFRKCWRELSDIAYAASDGRVPITVGIINTAHFKPWDWTFERCAKEFYGFLPNVHMASFHPYYEHDTSGTYFKFEPEAQVDILVAQGLGKTGYMGELGIAISQPDRVGKLAGIVNRMVPNGVTAISYWEIDPGGIDKGYCGGHCISPYRNADYSAMLSEIRSINVNYFNQ